MSGLADDLRHSRRALWRAPGFTVAAVLTLALGIGATTTLVSALDALLFRPPAAVEQPDRLVRTYFRHHNAQFGDWTNSVVSYPDFTDLQRARTLSGIAAQYGTSVSLGRGAEAREIDVLAVTGTYFSMLGARPLLGRLLGPDDDRADNGAPAVVLSERFWRSRFGADPAVLGRSMPLDDRVYTIAGIAPRGFDGGNYDAPDAWVAFTPVAARLGDANYRNDRRWYFISLIGRLAPGATPAQAAAEATALIRASQSDSATGNSFKEVMLGPVQEARGPDHSSGARLAYWLAGMSLVVLLIACANVANLLLVRGLVRGRELAIRKAIGATQGRIARQLFLEGVWLALLAGGAGIVICLWGGDLLRRFVLPAGMAATFTQDHRVFAIAGGATLLAAILSSLVPALQVVRGDLTPVLKEGGRASGFRRSRTRAGLVVAQVALSVLLVVGAGLFLRSLRNVLAIDIGYDRGHIVMVHADPRSAGFDGPATGQAFDAMVQAALAYPGVESAALTYGEPFGWSLARRLRWAGHDSLPRFSSGGPYIQSVTADYFRTMGLQVLRGRGFTDADRREHPQVTLLGATMARRFFGATDPLGQCLYIGDATTCTEVIGVVRDGIRYSPQEEPQGLYYVPLPPAGAETSHLTLFIRTRGEAAAVVSGLQSALQTAAPNLPYVRAEPLDEVLAPRFQPYRLGAGLFGLFAAVALGLAGIGIYSVLAYTVRGRNRELGVRLALGASPGSLVSLVLRDALTLVGAGVALGLLGAAGGGRALASLLYGVNPTDPPVLLVSGLVLLLVAVSASLIPARRAARVDPMLTLRTE